MLGCVVALGLTLGLAPTSLSAAHSPDGSPDSPVVVAPEIVPDAYLGCRPCWNGFANDHTDDEGHWHECGTPGTQPIFAGAYDADECHGFQAGESCADAHTRCSFGFLDEFEADNFKDLVDVLRALPLGELHALSEGKKSFEIRDGFAVVKDCTGEFVLESWLAKE